MFRWGRTCLGRYFGRVEHRKCMSLREPATHLCESPATGEKKLYFATQNG